MDVHTHEDMSDQKYLNPFDGKFFTNHKIGPFNCHAILDRIMLEKFLRGLRNVEIQHL